MERGREEERKREGGWRDEGKDEEQVHGDVIGTRVRERVEERTRTCEDGGRETETMAD
jgi:protein tyrosine/serine phosphatase